MFNNTNLKVGILLKRIIDKNISFDEFMQFLRFSLKTKYENSILPTQEEKCRLDNEKLNVLNE